MLGGRTELDSSAEAAALSVSRISREPKRSQTGRAMGYYTRMQTTPLPTRRAVLRVGGADLFGLSPDCSRQRHLTGSDN